MFKAALNAFLLLFAISLPAQTILVRPYIQPGNGTSLVGTDVKVIAWLTDQEPGEFEVDYGTSDQYGKTVQPVRTAFSFSAKKEYFKYTAALAGLPFNAEIHYRVRLGKKKIQAESFHTRKTAEEKIKFIVVGDTADGKASQKVVANQMWKAAPDFLAIVGDIVYPKGRVSEYLDHFWNVYNYEGKPGPKKGVPFMSSIPVYPILGNHDVLYATNLTQITDGMGAFYFFNPPLNGPATCQSFTPLIGAKVDVANFKKAAGPTYPGLCYYSFDDGPAHFLCLDANPYSHFTDAALREWVKSDLMQSKATWKFVLFHQPGFSASFRHAAEQQMRWFSPIFEAAGVDVVFSGHVHNYQRSLPLRFEPTKDAEKLKGLLVPGKFTLDEEFDGRKNTRPKGIIYIVTGGGGAMLYDTDLTNNPKNWKRTANDEINFTAKFISDRHSFTTVTLTRQKFELRQIDDQGEEIDRIDITKPAP